MPAPSSVSEDDINDAIQRYLKGEGRILEIAKSIGVGAPRFKREMEARGFRVRTKSEGQALRHVRDVDTPWKARFTAASARAREGWVYSDANRERFSQLGREKTIANQGRKPTDRQLSLRSEAHQRGLLKLSPLAVDLQAMLEARGLATTLEQASGRYNIDIAVSPVAVEVHRYSFNPLGATRLHERKRTNYLCNRGWLVCYVWIRPRQYLLTDDAADYVVSLAEEAKRDPSLIGEYRVIRGTGELFATGRGDGNELA